MFVETLFSLYSFIESTVNLFTSGQSIQFTGYAMQNSKCYKNCPYCLKYLVPDIPTSQ